MLCVFPAGMIMMRCLFLSVPKEINQPQNFVFWCQLLPMLSMEIMRDRIMNLHGWIGSLNGTHTRTTQLFFQATGYPLIITMWTAAEFVTPLINVRFLIYVPGTLHLVKPPARVCVTFRRTAI